MSWVGDMRGSVNRKYDAVAIARLLRNGEGEGVHVPTTGDVELTIMLALALGRIRSGQPEHLRSLVKPA